MGLLKTGLKAGACRSGPTLTAPAVRIVVGQPHDHGQADRRGRVRRARSSAAATPPTDAPTPSSSHPPASAPVPSCRWRPRRRKPASPLRSRPGSEPPCATCSARSRSLQSNRRELPAGLAGRVASCSRRPTSACASTSTSASERSGSRPRCTERSPRSGHAARSPSSRSLTSSGSPAPRSCRPSTASKPPGWSNASATQPTDAPTHSSPAATDTPPCADARAAIAQIDDQLDQALGGRQHRYELNRTTPQAPPQQLKVRKWMTSPSPVAGIRRLLGCCACGDFSFALRVRD